MCRKNFRIIIYRHLIEFSAGSVDHIVTVLRVIGHEALDRVQMVECDENYVLRSGANHQLVLEGH